MRTIDIIIPNEGENTATLYTQERTLTVPYCQRIGDPDALYGRHPDGTRRSLGEFLSVL
jgi:hypothetical protein